MYVVGEEEANAVAQVIRSGALFRYGIGNECERFETRYASHLGVRHFALAASGSNALAAAMTALGLGPGDEVLVPAHTYMATATSVLSVGAIPVIVDVDESITIDPKAVEDADRPAHAGRRARAHVGRGLRHGRDNGDRPTARPPRDRGHLPGRRRQLPGRAQARLDRPCRRVQLQLLQEHDRRRGRRGGRQRRPAGLAGARRHRPVPLLLERARRGEAVLVQRGARLGADGRDAQRPARPAAGDDRRDARREEARPRRHREPRQPRAAADPDERPRRRLRRACDVPPAHGRGGEALRLDLPERHRRQDRAAHLHRVGPGADRGGCGASADEPLPDAGERGVPPDLQPRHVRRLARRSSSARSWFRWIRGIPTRRSTT